MHQLRTSPTLIPASHRLGWLLMAGWAGLSLIAGAWCLVDDRGYYLLLGWTACLIVTAPLIVRKIPYDLASPWSFIVFAVYVGCGIRPWFIAMNIDGDRRTIQSLFLLGRDPDFFIWPSLLFNLCLGLMALAYVAASRPTRPPTRRQAPHLFGQLAPYVVVGCALIGVVAFVLFVRQNGGVSLDTLSAKRRRNDGLDLVGQEGSGGVLRQLCEFSSYAYWIAVAMFAAGGKHHGLLTFRGLILAGLFVNAAALPIYASSRSDAAYILIIGAVIDVVLNKQRVRVLRTAAAGALAVTVLVGALTIARASSGGQDANFSIKDTIGNTFVFTRSFTDQSTTSQIIRAVPDKLPWANGSTYAAWLVAAVPRRYWAEKPFIGTGPVVGVRVFGTAGSGVRPGFIAEAYWNFGTVGALALSLLMGAGLRRVYEWCLPRLVSPTAVVLYSAVALRLGAAMFSVGPGYAIFGALTTTVLLSAVLALARGSEMAVPLSAEPRRARARAH